MTVIFGTNADDSLTGTDEKDIAFGRAGNDTILGQDSDDVLFGGAGDDLIVGEDGNDLLGGGDGNDDIYGGNGNNLIFGGNGNDSLEVGFDIANQSATSFIYGGNGDDNLRSGYSDDNLYGEDGNDFLYGFLGNDTLNGGAGNDLLDGSFHSEYEIDSLTGGAGADTFKLGGSIYGEAAPYYRGDNRNYALITDFNKGEDTILLQRLEGDISHDSTVEVQYSLGAAPESLAQGTGIYVNNQGQQPDLIAILQGVAPDSLNLSESYFQILVL